MAVDPSRVAMVYASGQTAGVGSAYLVGTGVLLTAAHVVTRAGLQCGDQVDVLPHGRSDWLPATVSWLDPKGRLDGALLSFRQPEEWRPRSAVQWGRLPGAAPVEAAAMGYPSSLRRPDRSRGHESLVGFVTPPQDQVSGTLPIHALTSVPRDDVEMGSPWGGMSGAALLAGPHVVGVVIVDPGRFGPDRLLALPVSALLDDDEFTNVLGTVPDVASVGTEWRLQYGGAPEQSVLLRPPYRPVPPGYNLTADPYLLLRPEHRVAAFQGRQPLVDHLVSWAVETTTPLAIKTVTGSGGSGKTRLAAEVCLAMAQQGWDAGFADARAPGGEIRCHLEAPTLLVIDDADVRFREAAAIVRATLYSPVRVRLLLLARSRTGWWNGLHTESDGIAAGFDSGSLPLSSERLDAAARVDLFETAFESFRSCLAREPLELPAVDLDAEAFGDPLLVQLAALTALLSPTSDQPGFSDTARVAILRSAVGREALRWVRMLSEQDASEPERVLRRCVSAATLAHPRYRPDADQLETVAARFLRTVPDLVDADATRLRTLTAWLRELHPGPHYWNPLRPDALADQLLADLDVLPHLALQLHSAAEELNDVETVVHLLTELTRAASAAGGAAKQALQRLLRSEP